MDIRGWLKSIVSNAIANPTSFRAFIRALGGQWFTAMSGPLSVPFAFLALLVGSTGLKIVFGVLAITCAVFASYWVWRTERQRGNELAERLAPKLRFVFGEGSPFEMQSETIEPVSRWQRFRVGVRNDSGATLDHVGVDVVEIQPKHLERIIQLPLPLLPMHDLPDPLDPGQSRMFDVVHRGYYPEVPHPSFQGNGDAIELCHAVEHLGPLRVPLQNLELTLQAHGADVPPRLQRVAVVAAGRHGPLSLSLMPSSRREE